MNRGHFIIMGVAALAVALLVARMSAMGEQGKSSDKNNVAQPASEEDRPEPDICENAFCITLAGGISFSENVFRDSGDAKLKARGYDTYFEHYKKFLKSSDVVIAGLESPLIDTPPIKDRRASRTNTYWADAKKIGRVFAEQNITAVSLANYHMLDYGEEGLKKTMETLKQQNVDWFGVAEAGTGPAAPYRLEKNIDGKTFKLAILGITQRQPGNDSTGAWEFASLDVQYLTEQIESLKREEPGVFVIVYPSWGRDYRWFTEKERSFIEPLVDAGADLVVGYGTHMIGDVERYNDRWLLYGLGNFVFNAPGPKKMRKTALSMSAMLRLVIKKEKDELKVEHRLYPVFTDNRENDYKGRFIDVKEMGVLYWALLDKHYLGFSRVRPARLRPGHDIYGRYIQMRVGGI